MIAPLTQEEIAKLEGQRDKVMQLVAEVHNALREIEIELIEAIQEHSKVKLRLEIAKSKKSLLTEQSRNLKTLEKFYE
jgi:hypothetical protein